MNTVQDCHFEEKTAMDLVTSKVYNTVNDRECTSARYTFILICNFFLFDNCVFVQNVPKEVCTTVQVDECERISRQICEKQAQNNCQVSVFAFWNCGSYA